MSRHQRQQGFTIVELMIAITVLSVMLLLGTVLLINIGKMYSKGVNMARTQAAARNIVDSVSRPLQFGGATILYGTNGTENSMCIGTIRFTYILDKQISNNPSATLNQVRHVLWRDTMVTQGTCNPLSINIASTPTDALSNNDGQELMPEGMRLRSFAVSSSSPYTISAEVIYGEYDLSPSGECTLQYGGQFCARAQLTTLVSKRL